MPNGRGLTPARLRLIKEILAPFAARLDRAVLFGSRSTGRYLPHSDIDLALYGPLTEKEADRLYTLFLESYLPVKVDVLNYQAINSSLLKQHIDLAGAPLFEKADSLDESANLPYSP
ncbi:MAG: nucleotidyltransferase domain-containing protein [Deltaproteobacteria bacterium]|jgi:predicted nucleotidyltransferase|nr:nucleotidyltransferase domain-containing protein [Deltaproteobacteria bacterium]